MLCWLPARAENQVLASAWVPSSHVLHAGAISPAARSTRGKEPRTRSARTNLQPYTLTTFRTVALIGSLIAIDVHARVNVATNKLHAHESSAGVFLRAPAVAIRNVGEIEMFANHNRADSSDIRSFRRFQFPVGVTRKLSTFYCAGVYAKFCRHNVVRSPRERQFLLAERDGHFTRTTEPSGRTLTGAYVSARVEHTANTPLQNPLNFNVLTEPTTRPPIVGARQERVLGFVQRSIYEKP
jgi:hypothetical protein